MKKTIHLFVFFCAILFVQITMAIPPIPINTGAKAGSQKQKFKRTFSASKINKTAFKSNSKNNVSISYDDFASHLEIGKERETVFTPNMISMNIGAINAGIKETWILPDLSLTTNFIATTQYQIAGSETDIYSSFGYGTNGFYSDDILERDDLYDLQTDKLTFVGYEEVVEGGDYENDDDWEEFQFDQLRAVIPLELGLNYSSIAKFENAEDATNYIEYTDSYTVIGQGTLQTYNDGDAEALKVIYKEETREFENDIEVSYSERYEIIFYSKKGHYVYAEIEDPWNSEGVVALTNITYHKLNSQTASVNTESLHAIKTFPNPITAGQLLTIESKISLAANSVDIYNVNGQRVSTLNFTNSKNNQYQTRVPNSLSGGLYFYQVKDTKGIVLTNGKIQVK